MIFTCLYTCIYRYSDFDEMFVRMVRRCPEGLFKKTMDISLSRMTLWEEKICSHDDFTSDFVSKINLKSFSWFPPIHYFKNAPECFEQPDLVMTRILHRGKHWFECGRLIPIFSKEFRNKIFDKISTNIRQARIIFFWVWPW